MRTRRDFLKLGGLFSAATVVAPTVILKALSEAPAADLERAYLSLTAEQLRLGRTLQALAQWGFLTPDDETESRLREMLDLPDRRDYVIDFNGRTLRDTPWLVA